MDKVTAILTVWKRDHIEEQVEALLGQSHPPSTIWIYHCCKFLSPRFDLRQRYPFIKYQFNTNDLGYFGRFSLGLHVKTPYLFILDDDVIPSSNWIANCIYHCTEHNSIISSAGRIIPKGNYLPEHINSNEHLSEYIIGDGNDSNYMNNCPQNTFVDFGCNSWFIKTDWLQYFWAIKPVSQETGEDIHLSAACAIKAGIKTLCPVQDGKETCGNLRKFYGFDQLASWKKEGFLSQREKVIRGLIDIHGWKPIRWWSYS